MNKLQIHLIDIPHSKDDRGSFTKLFTNESIEKIVGLDTALKFAECYYSHSKKDVIRGMHFQTPPFDHHKVIHVIKGAIVDVVLDIRKESPNYGKYTTFNLSEDKKQLLFIPKGFAHGFHALEDSVVQYFQTTAYAPSNDKGIKYDTFSFPWGTKTPIISERDKAFPPLANLNSPF